MSLYSRYSESSISVSYFSRSSALICSAVLLRLIRPAQPVGRGGFHLSPPIVGVLTRWVRSTIDYARLPGPTSGRASPHRHQAPRAARAGCHPPDINEGIPMLRTRAQLVQRSCVRKRAVALVV